MKKLSENNLCAANSKAAEKLLAWYDVNARIMPWRVGSACSRQGQYADPYHVWLSEIMLQQTQVKTVHEYYLKFLKLWPTITDLATCQTNEVLKAWSGLGYYSRARNLKKCAEIIYHQHLGVFPSNAVELKELPGIGEYTSAAIGAIAFGEPIAVVDGNVERVMSRRYAMVQPINRAKVEIRRLTQELVPNHRPGDFAQAMMDLGATVCTPKKPSCEICPWQKDCRAFKQGKQTDYPVKVTAKTKLRRKGAAFVVVNEAGEILLRQREMKGMLAGMSEVPTSDWSAAKDGDTSIDAAPMAADWKYRGFIRHSFTHFHLEMNVYYAQVDKSAAEDIKIDGWWVKQESIMKEALPSLIKKVLVMATNKFEGIA